MSVHALRKNLRANGFRFVPVRTKLKRPWGENWAERARLDEDIPWPDTAALSTGILGDGLVCLDLDIEVAETVSIVMQAAAHFMGAAPMRTRNDSSRVLLLYRSSEGAPSKRSITGTAGKIEALGRGQMFVAFGDHPDGAAYEWSPCAPDTFSRNKLPAVSQDALSAFLEAVAPYIGAEPPARPVTRSEPAPALPSGTPVVPERDRAYAAKALEAEVAKLAGMGPGSGRNAALNASCFVMGTLAANGSIDAQYAASALLQASDTNGHVLKHGEAQTIKTIESGISAGLAKPRPLLPDAPDIPIDGLLNTAKAVSNAPITKPSVKRAVKLIQGSQIEAKPITWLWDGYLPQGKLTLLAGDGGIGKSTIAFGLAGIVTRAGVWPDGTQCKQAGNVLIWSSEDDFADTIKPRLMAVGADHSRYGFIDGTVDEQAREDAFDAARDMDSLREAVNKIGGVSLMIIDPIVTAVSGDMHKANDVRRSLQTIVDFAAETNCAVIGITHFGKATQGRKSAERVIGSQAFAALARMVLVAAKDDESDRHVFTRAKSNNSVDTGGFAYSIEVLTVQGGITATRIAWGEILQGSSRSILATVEGEENEDSSQLNKAKAFLIKQLSNGPSPSKELIEYARETLNVSKNTIERAKKELNIVSRKGAFASGWVWELAFNPATANAVEALKTSPMSALV